MAIGDSFNNLPMEALIGAPLGAAATANLRLAQATYDFINNVWKDGDKTRVLDFKLERQKSDGVKEEFNVQAPMAALAQLPNLMIKTVDVEFTMEVKDSTKSESASSATGSFEGGGSFGLFSVHVSGSVTTSSSNTRSTDQSAKYDVRVHAEQAQPSEGMNKLAQVFASVIEPIASSSGK
ncbi:MAG: DUF2589 domain-containing protein [Byssovorax sp.]